MSYAAISIFAVGFLLAVLVAFTFVEDRRRNAFLLPIWVLNLAATLNWAWIFEWGSGLSTALVGNILATQVAFGGLLLVFRDTIRLTIILGPYLLMALLLVIWSSTSVAGVSLLNGVSVWLMLHIAVSMLGYGLVTVGAIAGFATILRDRAIKQRIRNRFLEQLPSVSSTSRIELLGLSSAEVLLGLGILFGVGAEYSTTGQFFEFTHKSLFSLLAFVLIGALLYIHLRSGLRGRFAARLGLTAYLLVSLGYPGVKFVTDILIS